MATNTELYYKCPTIWICHFLLSLRNKVEPCFCYYFHTYHSRQELIGLPLKFGSHCPLLIAGIRGTFHQLGLIRIVLLCAKAFVGVHMTNALIFFVVNPSLVSSHSMTPYKFYRSIRSCCIQAVVI